MAPWPLTGPLIRPVGQHVCGLPALGTESAGAWSWGTELLGNSGSLLGGLGDLGARDLALESGWMSYLGVAGLVAGVGELPWCSWTLVALGVMGAGAGTFREHGKGQESKPMVVSTHDMDVAESSQE